MAFFTQQQLACISESDVDDGTLPRTFVLRSSYGSTEVVAGGFLQSAGLGSRSYGAGNPAGTAPPVAMKIGDVVMAVSSTAPNTGNPGSVTWHSVISSTANVVSTQASSGYLAGYDVSLSSS